MPRDLSDIVSGPTVGSTSQQTICKAYAQGHHGSSWAVGCTRGAVTNVFFPLSNTKGVNKPWLSFSCLYLDIAIADRAGYGGDSGGEGGCVAD